jgi:hypothetical protein
MSQKQLILHVGFHKSGTSALQEASLTQRANSQHKAGVLYPNIGKKAHHRVAWGTEPKALGVEGKGC